MEEKVDSEHRHPDVSGPQLEKSAESGPQLQKSAEYQHH